jgi:hypothetical protein
MVSRRGAGLAGSGTSDLGCNTPGLAGAPRFGGASLAGNLALAGAIRDLAVGCG